MLAVLLLIAGAAGGSAEASSNSTGAKLIELNRLANLPYAEWRSSYNDLRQSADYQWMDWSQDGCSGPNLWYHDDFYYGCLRHDLSWRTLAVIDRSTGRVWNERNRYAADLRFKKDNIAYCDQRHGSRTTRAVQSAKWKCTIASNAYYRAVRGFAGYRKNLTIAEKESVSNRPDYIITAVESCSYAVNPDNRCLPINYLELDGKPLAPHNIARIPTGQVILLHSVRANQQSMKGSPDNAGNTGYYRSTGELRIRSNYPLLASSSPNIDCSDYVNPAFVYAESDDYPVHNLDSVLKIHPLYVKICRATSASEQSKALLEINPVWAASGGDSLFSRYIIGQGKRVRHYQNIKAMNLDVELSPNPDQFSFAPDGSWSRALTVVANANLGKVRIVANPDGHERLVEITRSATSANLCSNGAEPNDMRTVSRSSTVYLAMCSPGAGVVELRDPETGFVLETYHLIAGVPPPSGVTLRRDSGNPGRLAAYFTPSSWDASNGHYYRLELEQQAATAGSGRPDRAVVNPQWELFATAKSRSSPHNFDNLAPDRSYRARGQRCASSDYAVCGEWSDWSQEVYLPASAAAPGQPRRLSATAGDGQLTVAWQPPANDGGAAITGYALRYKRDGATTDANPYQSVYGIKADARSHTITGLTNGEDYTVQVWAVNSVGSGIANRAELTGLTPAAPAITPTSQCLPVSAFAAERTSGSAVRLTWQNPAGGLTAQQRRININKWSGGQWVAEQQITVRTGSQQAWHLGIDRAAYYAYTVRSECAGDRNSGWSSWETVAPFTGRGRRSGEETIPTPTPRPDAGAGPDAAGPYEPPPEPLP